MLTIQKQNVAIYVDRTTRHWVVRDPDGNFWSLPYTDNPWNDRESFDATPESDLVSVPGYYKTTLCLPY